MVGLFCAYMPGKPDYPWRGLSALVGILGRADQPKGFLGQARWQGQPALYGHWLNRHLVHQYE
jgi:hypothetical protein